MRRTTKIRGKSDMAALKGKEFWGKYEEYSRWLQEQGGDNSEQLERVKRNLRVAMEEELTERQREMLGMMFNEGLGVREIARELNVAPSTVSRTVRRAKTRLKNALKYSF